MFDGISLEIFGFYLSLFLSFWTVEIISHVVLRSRTRIAKWEAKGLLIWQLELLYTVNIPLSGMDKKNVNLVNKAIFTTT